MDADTPPAGGSHLLPELPPRLAPAAIPAARVQRRDVESTDAGMRTMGVREAVAVLRRHLVLLLAVLTLTVLAAGYVIHNQSLLYEANAVIRLMDQRQQLAGNIDNTPVASMMGYWADPIASQLQVLSSRGVAEAVVDSQTLGLRVLPVDFPASILTNVSIAPHAPRDSVFLTFGAKAVTVQDASGTRRAAYGSPIQSSGATFTVMARPSASQSGTIYTVDRRSAADMLLSGLRTRQRDRTDVIDVSYIATDPYVAQQVVNAVVKVFQQDNAERAQEQSRRRRIFVQAQLEQTDSLLQIAQSRLSEYRANNKVYSSADAVVNTQQTGLLDLDVKRQELTASRQVSQSLLDDLALDDGPSRRKALRALVASPEIASNPVVASSYQQLVQYQTALDSMTTGRFARAATNPDVQRLESLVGEQENQLSDAVKSQVVSLDARIAALDQVRASNAAMLKKLPATAAGEARLLGQVQSLNNMADQLRQDFQIARISEAVEEGEVEIVDLALAPYAPIGIGRKAKLGIAIVFGLLFGIGAAMLADRFNTAIRGRNDIEDLLQIPGLAIIPQIASATQMRHVRVGSMNLPLGSALTRIAARHDGARSSRESLVTVLDARSGGAEAFRTLRTNLIFSQAVQTLRVIVITSPSPQDGKTTTVANLAVTFAQQGMRVAIIDCDLRRARLHAVFRTPRDPGLTHYLMGQAAEEDILRPTFVDGLWFISSGALPPNPSELLGGERMHELAASLKKRFDVVLLDTPPVHAAADSLILGKVSDGVLLVLRAGHTERASALDAIHRLTTIGIRVVGAVLNDPDHKVSEYEGYYYYDYYGPEAVPS
ncbi:MAG TPA: polysaccharide biosynthesis tyrosine autokinase [Gemmatimonadaceae bacterium]|nr:polysaccharide biosynthesis tyrosine autokinase [Gemmatimonadaceae bacterium]